MHWAIIYYTSDLTDVTIARYLGNGEAFDRLDTNISLVFCAEIIHSSEPIGVLAWRCVCVSASPRDVYRRAHGMSIGERSASA